ncbi:MAG TPA: hypothetical protein VNF06_00400 [Candidatus Aquilonibacter sp.]|nr:hypothetical protein [Candidatus Aquilonibacter sp.]
MSQTKQIKTAQAESLINSKEESKLDTTYDKILNRISPSILSRNLSFITDHKDFNSEVDSVKTIQVVLDETLAQKKVTFEVFAFKITPIIENNFLHPENKMVTMALSVSGKEYMALAREISFELGNILNAHVKINLVRENPRLVSAFDLPRA